MCNMEYATLMYCEILKSKCPSVTTISCDCSYSLFSGNHDKNEVRAVYVHM